MLGDPLQFGDTADIGGIRTDDADGLGLDQFLEVVAQVDLLAGMDRRRGRVRQLAIGLRIDPRHVVAGQHVLEPHDVVVLDRTGELDRVVEEPARAAVERQGDAVAQRFLHGDNAVEHVVEAVLGDLPLIHGAVIAGLLALGTVVEVLVAVLHRRVEADALLDHEEVLRLLGHPLDVGGEILGAVAGTGASDRAVINANLVAHLAAEQLVDRNARGLAGNIPQRMLDHRDGGAIGLERAALADLHHAALDIGRVFADQRVAEMQDERLEVGLGVFNLADTIQALIGDDADDRVLADDGNAQIGNLHLFILGPTLGSLPCVKTGPVRSPAFLCL